MINVEQNYIVLRTIVLRNAFYVIYKGAEVMFNSVLHVIKYVTIAFLKYALENKTDVGNPSNGKMKLLWKWKILL